jgi:DNA-directed RNA polymerase subunit RPC12/RpoP
MMAEVINYDGQIGLMAILQALENVRQMLDASEITSKQAVSFLGCIDLHLAQMVGVQGDFLAELEECGGLLCPSCKGFVGFISNLSGECPHCGAQILPRPRKRIQAAVEAG